MNDIYTFVFHFHTIFLSSLKREKKYLKLNYLLFYHTIRVKNTPTVQSTGFFGSIQPIHAYKFIDFSLDWQSRTTYTRSH